VIDPGHIDSSFISVIEKNGYTLKAVLLSHAHRSHAYGVRTLRKIYDFTIYAAKSDMPNTWLETGDSNSVIVRDEDEFDVGPMHFKVLSVPGHTADSVAFLCENMLFTGDALSAGVVGQTGSIYGAAKEMMNLRNSILTLQPNVVVMPGHGPPTSIETERRFNVGMSHYEENLRRERRKPFPLDLLT
jgi:glyoxylase-like metal-dependent hydrolase (beta-lactamase superfamily II)